MVFFYRSSDQGRVWPGKMKGMVMEDVWVVEMESLGGSEEWWWWFVRWREKVLVVEFWRRLDLAFFKLEEREWRSWFGGSER